MLRNFHLTEIELEQIELEKTEEAARKKHPEKAQKWPFSMTDPKSTHYFWTTCTSPMNKYEYITFKPSFYGHWRMT
eukprot:3128989-Ditylum_brightwellii.AAC.1